MIIDSSNINLASNHTQVKKHETSEKLKAWASSVSPAEEKHQKGHGDKVSISEKAQKHLDKDINKMLKHLNKNIEKAMKHPEKGLEKTLHHLEKDISKIMKHLEKDIARIMGRQSKDIEKTINDLNKFLDPDKIGKRENRNDRAMTKFTEKLFKAITGKKVKLNRLDDHHDDHDHHKKAKSQEKTTAWGLEYERHESYYEKEELSFNAGGIVKTADGREINFSLDMMMSREFMYENDFKLSAGGVGTGNEVVNLDELASQLTNKPFDFEMQDEDDNETDSYLTIGNGVLTLDLNEDGEISDESELFGATTGNGFNELAVYDKDGNNWIDENDSIYESLKVQTVDSEGVSSQSGLKESNVGAIYLGNVDSEFSLKDSENKAAGQLEKSGVYLSEDGTPGMVSQIKA